MPVGVGRQESVDEAEDAKGTDHPSVGTVLPDSSANVALGEKRGCAERNGHDGQRDQRRM